MHVSLLAVYQLDAQMHESTDTIYGWTWNGPMQAQSDTFWDAAECPPLLARGSVGEGNIAMENHHV